MEGSDIEQKMEKFIQKMYSPTFSKNTKNDNMPINSNAISTGIQTNQITITSQDQQPIPCENAPNSMQFGKSRLSNNLPNFQISEPSYKNKLNAKSFVLYNKNSELLNNSQNSGNLSFGHEENLENEEKPVKSIREKIRRKYRKKSKMFSVANRNFYYNRPKYHTDLENSGENTSMIQNKSYISKSFGYIPNWSPYQDWYKTGLYKKIRLGIIEFNFEKDENTYYEHEVNSFLRLLKLKLRNTENLDNSDSEILRDYCKKAYNTAQKLCGELFFGKSQYFINPSSLSSVFL